MKNLTITTLFFLLVILSFTGCVNQNRDQKLERNNFPEEQNDYLTVDPKLSNHQKYNMELEFSSSDKVMSYLSDKNFKSPEGSKVVHIGQDGISINGTPAYFNLDITLGGKTTAFIRAESINNPNGVINIRVEANRDCIYNDGTSFCL